MDGSEFGINNMKLCINSSGCWWKYNGAFSHHSDQILSNRTFLGCGDAVMSVWTQITEECFQHLAESVLRRVKAVPKEKLSPTWY